MATLRRAPVTLPLALFTLLLPGTALWAQPDLRNSSYLGIGYVTSVPDIFVGVTALGLTPGLLGGAGLLADVKFTHDSPGRDAYFRDDISVEQAEITFADQLYRERSAWLSVDLAVVYAITGNFAVYAGGGYLKEEHYREYFDDSITRGNEGFYWVLDESASRSRANALGGALFRLMPYIVFQVGLETRPGAIVGVTFTIPF
jgi:hypothetical protein